MTQSKTFTKIKKRNITGVLLLDKPIGITSNQALQQIKHWYAAKKAGHTGSLDPLASGMLPICLGDATKFSQFLLEADKIYTVTGKLGVITASGDTDSPIIETRPVGTYSKNSIEKVLSKFRGTILQLPSMYSAIKHNGEPLYKLARKGVEIERKPREIKIFELELISSQGDEITLRVHCSKGTYIRTLVADIGEQLGCGAHAIGLRRLAVSGYQESQMLSFDKIRELALQSMSNLQFEQTAPSSSPTIDSAIEPSRASAFAQLDALLLPVESMLNSLPVLQLTENMVYYLRQGNPIVIPHAPSSGLVSLQRKSGEFVGVGEIATDGKVAPRRLR